LIHEVLRSRDARLASFHEVLESRRAWIRSRRPPINARRAQIKARRPPITARDGGLAFIHEVLQWRHGRLALVREVLRGRGERLALIHEALEASRPRIKARRGRIEGRPYGSKVLLPSYAPLVRTTKISIAIEKEHLRLARKAAISEGLSLSGYIARALGSRLEDQRRIDAARELQASWGPESLPTPGDRERFLTRMSRGRRKRRARAA
jgi:hypothetical protein